MEFPAGHRSDLVNKSIDGALVLLVRRQRWHRQHVAVAGPSESFMGAAAGGRRRRWLAAASPGHGLPFIAPRQSLPSSEMFFFCIYNSDEINVYALLVHMMNKDATYIRTYLRWAGRCAAMWGGRTRTEAVATRSSSNVAAAAASSLPPFSFAPCIYDLSLPFN